MYRTMLDLIRPKLVYLDLPLFMALLSDLFPGVELPSTDGGAVRKMLEAELVAMGLQVVPEFVIKMIQIFDCKVRASSALWQQNSYTYPGIGNA